MLFVAIPFSKRNVHYNGTTVVALTDVIRTTVVPITNIIRTTVVRIAADKEYNIQIVGPVRIFSSPRHCSIDVVRIANIIGTTVVRKARIIGTTVLRIAKIIGTTVVLIDNSLFLIPILKSQMYLSTYVNFNHHFLTKQNVCCVDSKGKISSDDRILKYQKSLCY